MAITRANLLRGPARITWNGGTFYSRDDIGVSFDQTWEDVLTSCYEVVDAVETDRQIKISLTLWGAWENIAALFPSQFTNPSVGQRLYSGADLPMIIHQRGANGTTTSQLTIHNVQITKLSDLYLGLDNHIYAQCEFTGLIKDNSNPETAASYFTLTTATYNDSAFSFSNYSRQRYSAAWMDNQATPVAVPGFSSFEAHKGWNISWDIKGDFDYNANVGTVDYIVRGLQVTAKCNSIVGPTAAQIVTARRADGRALGKLVGEGRGSLTITAAPSAAPVSSITINKAAITDHALVYSQTQVTNGDITWKSFRGIGSTGTPQAIVSIV